MRINESRMYNNINKENARENKGGDRETRCALARAARDAPSWRSPQPRSHRTEPNGRTRPSRADNADAEPPRAAAPRADCCQRAMPNVSGGLERQPGPRHFASEPRPEQRHTRPRGTRRTRTPSDTTDSQRIQLTQDDRYRLGEERIQHSRPHAFHGHAGALDRRAWGRACIRHRSGRPRRLTRHGLRDGCHGRYAHATVPTTAQESGGGAFAAA